MNTIVIQNCKNFINKILSFMSETHTNKLEELDWKHSNKLTREKTAWIDRHHALEKSGYIPYQFNVTYLPNLKSAKGHTSEEVMKKWGMI